MQGFPIDLTVGRELVGQIDYLTPSQAIEVPDVAPVPVVACFPLADQIADKFAAMYEMRSGLPSTRWRDLVDLLLIIGSFSFDAANTLAALNDQVRQRPLLDSLPAAVHTPGPQWAHSYPGLAQRTNLPSALHTLDPALQLLSLCMNPLLAGIVRTGVWQPAGREWK